MTQGSYYDSIGGKRDIVKYFERGFDPGVEVGLDAAFEFQQASGEGVDTG